MAEDPASLFRSPLTTSPEELEELIWSRQRAARDSYRIVIVPKREGKSVSLVALEGPNKMTVLARGDERPQSTSSKPINYHEAIETKPQKSVRTERLIWMFGSPRTGNTSG